MVLVNLLLENANVKPVGQVRTVVNDSFYMETAMKRIIVLVILDGLGYFAITLPALATASMGCAYPLVNALAPPDGLDIPAMCFNVKANAMVMAYVFSANANAIRDSAEKIANRE
jgi:hypothetical protein